jgi:uncharacterized protein (TIGR02186 family)
MIARAARLAIVTAGLVVAAEAIGAERLVISLSDHRVMVTSSFSGEELVLFGAIERDGATPVRGGSYDIVVTVSGPRAPIVTRRKGRVLGIWVNVESKVADLAPAYLAVVSNKPLAEIADAETGRRLRLGFDNILLNQAEAKPGGEIRGDDPFRAALLRLKERAGLYWQLPSGVTFLTPLLFRASIPLPAEAPVGTYEVDVKLFQNGALVARASTALEVLKAGIEQFVVNAALNYGVLYGLATVLMALFTGWVASVVFRRD